ncbi:hypothetical protein WA026_018704 [Henosepilachna vigintioctopunctata]|uniref:BEN domain-containing protein n=1 Tax=Henosepilachna vigintioctopunctata TaxID=420089 RepID=A0AAW1TWR9_9CUCU
MDSFPCLLAPYPSKRPSLEPSVPDVSLLLNPSATNTYRNWKDNLPNEYEREDKHAIVKKQVRFDNSNVGLHSANHIQTDMNSAPNSCARNAYVQNHTLNQCCTPPLNKFFKNKQFQEVYMANIPNRNLDLSLIDIVKPVVKDVDSVVNYISEQPSSEESKVIHQRTPKTYKEFLEMQSCGIKDGELNKSGTDKETCITDIFNYTSPKFNPSVENSNKFKVLKCNKQINHIELSKGCTKPNKNSKTDEYNNDSSPNTKNFQHVITGQVEKFKRSYPPHPEQKLREFTTVENFHDMSSDNFHHQISTKLGPQMNKGKCDNAVQTSIACESQNSSEKVSSTEPEKNNDPTVRDLLKIIQQQNEQLLILQKQVASILECRDYQHPIESPRQILTMNQDKFLTNGGKNDVLENSGSTPRKGPLPKFSIDLMTSFEVSFRPQQNMNYRKHRDLILQEPKIQEITETENNDLEYQKEYAAKKFTDSSLRLQDPINVQETCPSPEPSIKIDMNDYEMSDEEEDEVTSGVGSSFYRNLMDQVNKIIQNAQIQTNGDNRSLKTEEWRDETLNRVKDCTIKHLRKIGMKFSTIDEVSTTSCSASVNESPEQISFAVKQLLMKYLPDDQLSRLALQNNKNFPKKRSEDKIILNSRAPEFSFNTVQFMKKYDLIANDGAKSPRKAIGPISGVPPRMSKKLNRTNPKILDISSLKQQPKLL